MSRESKQERLVRSMQEQASDHLHELKSLAANTMTKELDVERWAQSVLRSCFGFSAANGYAIRAQETRGNIRPDLMVLKNDKPIFVIEIKKLDFDLNKSDFRCGKAQLWEYLHTLGGIQWGLLCNGYEWRLYDFSDPTIGPVECMSFDLRNDEGEIELSKRAVEDVCWNFLELHESAYRGKEWDDLSKEARAFSPDSLARAILSADVMKHIAREIRGEHEYKANVEILTDKVINLLELGLDDSMIGWNDAKKAELQKYTKSQKRVARAKRAAVRVELKRIGPPDEVANAGEDSIDDSDKKVTSGEN